MLLETWRKDKRVRKPEILQKMVEKWIKWLRAMDMLA